MTCLSAGTRGDTHGGSDSAGSAGEDAAAPDAALELELSSTVAGAAVVGRLGAASDAAATRPESSAETVAAAVGASAADSGTDTAVPVAIACFTLACTVGGAPSAAGSLETDGATEPRVVEAGTGVVCGVTPLLPPPPLSDGRRCALTVPGTAWPLSDLPEPRPNISGVSHTNTPQLSWATHFLSVGSRVLARAAGAARISRCFHFAAHSFLCVSVDYAGGEQANDAALPETEPAAG